MDLPLIDRAARQRVASARSKMRIREFLGLLLWAASLVVIFGTVPLPFPLHLALVFLWLMTSGAVFVRLSRANVADMERVFQESLSHVSGAHDDIVMQMAKYSEARDAFTGEHLQRVRQIATQLALELGKSPEEAEIIGKAAIAHDIGKIGIPDYVLGKTGRLTEEEYSLIKTHTVIGAQILGASPLFNLERDCALHHHEWWNGCGYPNGLAAEAIPLVARIASVADVYDALVSWRPYKEPWSVERTVNYLEERSGTQFDPSVIEAFLRLHKRGELPSTPSDRISRERDATETAAV
jgi:HD-GYP domain-containing protein (c-di-GMP phosphodiesterase class II)